MAQPSSVPASRNINPYITIRNLEETERAAPAGRAEPPFRDFKVSVEKGKSLSSRNFRAIEMTSKKLGAYQVSLTEEGAKKFGSIIKNLRELKPEDLTRENFINKSVFRLVEDLKKLARTQDASGKWTYNPDALFALGQWLIEEEVDTFGPLSASSDIFVGLSKVLYALSSKGAQAYQKELEAFRSALKTAGHADLIHVLAGPRESSYLGALDGLLASGIKLIEQCKKDTDPSVPRQIWYARIQEASVTLKGLAAALAEDKESILFLTLPATASKENRIELNDVFGSIEKAVKDVSLALKKTEAALERQIEIEKQLEEIKQQLDAFESEGGEISPLASLPSIHSSSVLNLTQSSGSEALLTLKKSLEKEYDSLCTDFDESLGEVADGLENYLSELHDWVTLIKENPDLSTRLEQKKSQAHLLGFLTLTVALTGVVGMTLLGAGAILGMVATASIGVFAITMGLLALFFGGIAFGGIRKTLELVKKEVLIQDDMSLVAQKLLEDIQKRLEMILEPQHDRDIFQ